MGSGNSKGPNKGRDIVCSAWKHAAVHKRTAKAVACFSEHKDFSCIVYAKKMKLSDLENLKQQSDLLNITDEEKGLGFKHVFQTKVTADTTHERMRGPMGLFDNNETYMDNDANMALGRLHEYFSEV